MEPPDLAATGFEQAIEAVVMCPLTSRGTFRTSRTSSLLDFFIVSNRTAAAVERVETIEGTGTRGHTPVRLTFKARATALRALHLRRPPRLGCERVYGPLPPPPEWAQARMAAEEAFAATRGGGSDIQPLLDKAYQLWADRAEEEVADYVGEVPKKWGERGRLPNLVWRSAIPEASPRKQQPLAATAAWLGAVVGEARRISEAVEATADDGDDIGGIDDDPRAIHEGDDGDQSAGEEVRRARARRPPVQASKCGEVLREMTESIDRDCPECGDGEDGIMLMELRARVRQSVGRLRAVIQERSLGGRRGGYTVGRCQAGARGTAERDHGCRGSPNG